MLSLVKRNKYILFIVVAVLVVSSSGFIIYNSFKSKQNNKLIADNYYMKGKYKEALSYYNKIVDIDSEILIRIEKCHIQINEFNAAINIIDSIRNGSHNQELTYSELRDIAYDEVYCYHSMGDHVGFLDSAKGFFAITNGKDAVSKILSQRIEQYVIDYFLGKNEYSVCAENIKGFIQKYDSKSDKQHLIYLYTQFTNCYLGLGNYNQADIHNDWLIENDPDILKYYLTKGFIIGETEGKQNAYQYLSGLTGKFNNNEKLLAFMASYEKNQ